MLNNRKLKYKFLFQYKQHSLLTVKKIQTELITAASVSMRLKINPLCSPSPSSLMLFCHLLRSITLCKAFQVLVITKLLQVLKNLPLCETEMVEIPWL